MFHFFVSDCLNIGVSFNRSVSVVFYGNLLYLPNKQSVGHAIKDLGLIKVQKLTVALIWDSAWEMQNYLDTRDWSHTNLF